MDVAGETPRDRTLLDACLAGGEAADAPISTETLTAAVPADDRLARGDVAGADAADRAPRELEQVDLEAASADPAAGDVRHGVGARTVERRRVGA